MANSITVKRGSEAARKQKAWIDHARKATEAREVALHKCPKWARKAIRNAIPDAGHVLDVSGGVPSSFDGVHLFDHWGTSRIERHGYTGPTLVTEPYGYREHVEAALRFADLIGCNVEIGRASWWFPGSTVRIEFYPKDTTP